MNPKSLQLYIIATLICKSSSFVPTTYSLPSKNIQFGVKATRTTAEQVDSDAFVANNQLLDKALSSDTESAQLLITKLAEYRKNKDQEGYDTFLNSLLANIESTPSKPLPRWTKFRIAAKFSKRARRASLDRVIGLSSLTEEDDKTDDVLSTQSRRRRSLLLLLRSLADKDTEDTSKNDMKSSSRITIYKLEKIARKEAKKRISPEDILGRVPDGLETPSYKVLKTDYSSSPIFYEIRQYDPFSTCTVQMSSPKPSSSSSPGPAAAGSAFGSLAGYLFGKNQSSKKMAMTTPVFTSSVNDLKQMSFVLPSEYWTQLQNAPKPMENNSDSEEDSALSGVKLILEASQTRAVLLFGGFASKKEVDKQKKELLEMLKQDPDWMVESDASSEKGIILAQYNDPFTPPWKRRNEVSILIAPRN